MDDAALRSAIPPRTPRAFLRWFWRLVRDIADEYANDGVGDLAASITFWTLLSIPAAVLAFVSTLSSMESIVGTSVADRVREETVGFIDRTFQASGPITDTVTELFTESSAGVATVATIAAVFTLSRAFAGLIRALDRAYGIRAGRPWWYLRIVAIGLGLGTLMIIVSSVVVLTLLPRLPLPQWTQILTSIAVFAGVIGWVSLMFHIGPNHRTPWRLDIPGAVVTALGWYLVVQGFSLYIRITADSNEVQSSVGAVLLALTLMYAMAVILMVGAELNDVLAQRTQLARENEAIGDRLRTMRAKIRQRRPPEKHE